MAERHASCSLEKVDEEQTAKMSRLSLSSPAESTQVIIQNSVEILTERRPSPLLEEENQIDKMSQLSLPPPAEALGAIIENSTVFKPMILDVLPKIINNLDPCSFVRLSRTCKEMNKFCFNNKNIRIPCWKEDSVRVWMDVNPSNHCIWVNDLCYLANSDFMKKLSTMPFVYCLKKFGVSFSTTEDERLLSEMRNYCSKFPHVFIDAIQIYLWRINAWESLIAFIEDFHVTSFETTFNEVPSEFQSFFTQKMTSFTCNSYMPDDVIVAATSAHMCLPGATISIASFKKLIKKFASGEIKNWIIGREVSLGVFRFMSAISEVMKTVQVDTIDETKMQPNVIYVTPARPKRFYLLKSDGSMGYFALDENLVVFGYWY